MRSLFLILSLFGYSAYAPTGISFTGFDGETHTIPPEATLTQLEQEARSIYQQLMDGGGGLPTKGTLAGELALTSPGSPYYRLLRRLDRMKEMKRELGLGIDPSLPYLENQVANQRTDVEIATENAKREKSAAGRDGTPRTTWAREVVKRQERLDALEEFHNNLKAFPKDIELATQDLTFEAVRNLTQSNAVALPEKTMSILKHRLQNEPHFASAVMNMMVPPNRRDQKTLNIGGPQSLELFATAVANRRATKPKIEAVAQTSNQPLPIESAPTLAFIANQTGLQRLEATGLKFYGLPNREAVRAGEGLPWLADAIADSSVPAPARANDPAERERTSFRAGCAGGFAAAAATP